MQRRSQDGLQSPRPNIGMVRKELRDPLTRDEPDAETGTGAQDITDDLHIFGLSYAGEIAAAYRDTTYPFGLGGVRDRKLDVWQPLFVLAQIVDREIGSEQISEELMELH